jgi:hypothetical protein
MPDDAIVVHVLVRDYGLIQQIVAEGLIALILAVLLLFPSTVLDLIGALGGLHELYMAKKRFYAEGKLPATFLAKTCVRIGKARSPPIAPRGLP